MKNPETKGIIFFDLDGTLLNERSEISTENRLLLLLLDDLNYLLVAASGRSPKEIETIVGRSPISSYVSLNGQYVVYEKKCISHHAIPAELITELLSFANKFQTPVAMYGKEDYRINFINSATKKLYKLDNADLPQIDETYFLDEEIFMLYLFNETPEYDELFMEEFKGLLTFYRDSPYSLAVILHGRSKKQGIYDIYQQLSPDVIKNSFAFGDGMNDISMLQSVTHSIAMGNASDSVKKIADYVTTSHTDSGILTGLKHYKII